MDWDLHRLGLEIDSLRAQLGRDEKSEVLVKADAPAKAEATQEAPETESESKDSQG